MRKIAVSAGYLLAAIRAIIIIALLIVFLMIFLATERLARDRIRYAERWKRWYCRSVLFILACEVKVDFEKQPLPNTYLLVSNHLSFFDPVVTLAFARGMPLAKAEIRKYPIIGYAALKTGIIYVQREEKSSRKSAREAVVLALSQDRPVLVYPEGTISPKANQLHPFKVGVFKSAHSSETPILSVCIQYSSDRGLWTDERTLLQQYFYQFSLLRQKIELNFSDDLRKESPQESAMSSKEWIEKHFN